MADRPLRSVVEAQLRNGRTDCFHELQDDPEGFVNWLRDNLSGQGSKGLEKYGTEVMPVDHSTSFRLYALDGSTIVDLSRFSPTTRDAASRGPTQRQWLIDVTERAIREARALLKTLQSIEPEGGG